METGLSLPSPLVADQPKSPEAFRSFVPPFVSPSLLPATTPHPTPAPCAQGPGVPPALSLCTGGSPARNALLLRRLSPVLLGPQWCSVETSLEVAAERASLGGTLNQGEACGRGRPGDSSVGLAWVWRLAAGSGQCCCLSDGMPSGTQARPRPL